MALSIHSLIIVMLCITMEVNCEMSGDLVYSLLNDQIKNMAIKMYAIEKEQVSINLRLDDIESQFSQPSHNGIANIDDVSGNIDRRISKKKEDRILKALAAEKTLIRNMLNSYEGELTAFQNAVSNQINWMNKTFETKKEHMKREQEENAVAFNNKITLLKENFEISTVKLERKLGRKTLAINKSMNELKSECESKQRDTIMMFETALNNTTKEHVADYGKLQKMIESLQTPTEGSTTSSTATTATTETTAAATSAPTTMETAKAPIKVGDKVRVKSSIIDPTDGWGYVTHDSVGTVTSIYPDIERIMIDFPEQGIWFGVIDEMEHV